MIDLKKIFKKANNVGEPATSSKRRFVLILAVAAIVTGFASFYYFSDFMQPNIARQDIAKDLFPDNIQTTPTTPDVAMQHNIPHVTETPVVGTPAPIPPATGTVAPAATVRQADMSPPAPQANIRQQRLYIPATDILSNVAVLRQQYEDRVQLVKTQVELQKLNNELRRAIEESHIIPVQARAQISEAAGRIAERQYQPVIVEKPLILPELLSTQTTNGQITALFSLPGGQRVRGSSGSVIGEFTVRSVSSNIATLSDTRGQLHTVHLAMPDRFPVSAPMFSGAGAPTGPVVEQPPPGVQHVPMPMPPQFQPMPPPQRR